MKQNDKSKKRVIVTGGAGFIGSHLTDTLLRRGHEVLVIDDLSTGSLDNLSEALYSPSFSFKKIDASACDWNALLQECDCVFHLAATVGVSKVHESALETADNNLRPLQKILNASMKTGTRIFYSSTSEVYGDTKPEGASESEILQATVDFGGRSAYTLAKMYGEMLCLAYWDEHQVPVTVMRFFNTIGTRQKGQYGMVVPKFIQRIFAGQCPQIYGDGQQTRSFCAVEDTIEAMLALWDTPASVGQIYNIGNKDEISILELAEHLCKCAGTAPKAEFLPFPPEREGHSDIRFRRPNVEKILRDAGWSPKRNWKEATARLVELEKVVCASRLVG